MKPQFRFLSLPFVGKLTSSRLVGAEISKRKFQGGRILLNVTWLVSKKDPSVLVGRLGEGCNKIIECLLLFVWLALKMRTEGFDAMQKDLAKSMVKENSSLDFDSLSCCW
jgi:hypothetical protein